MTNQEKIEVLTKIKLELQTTMFICTALTRLGLPKHMLGELRLYDALTLARGVYHYAFFPYKVKDSSDLYKPFGSSVKGEAEVEEAYRYWKVQLCDSAIELIKKEAEE